MADTVRSRACAVRILESIVERNHPSDEAFSADKGYATLPEVDRRFVRLLVTTCLRRLGQVDGVLAKLLKKPLPPKQKTARTILRLGVTQALFLNTPDYAFVNTSVTIAHHMHLDGLSGLINGVLRGLTRLDTPLAGLESPTVNIPDWLYASWVSAYGKNRAEAFASTLIQVPPLDITAADNPTAWAEKWNGRVLETGSIRVAGGSPESLDGFSTGRVWVQNGAASVPAQLFSDVMDKTVADLCAAPGGKTAQLAARGAWVYAYDISEKRLGRLRENMLRLGFAERVRVARADVLALDGQDLFDAVLLDAPCSATGTIQRHPEVKYIRRREDIIRLADLQKQLLRRAITLAKQGGEVVFSTCSLQPEEGDDVVRPFLTAGLVDVVRPTDDRWQPFITPFGSLRFCPDMGYDGFYACLLCKK